MGIIYFYFIMEGIEIWGFGVLNYGRDEVGI